MKMMKHQIVCLEIVLLQPQLLMIGKAVNTDH